MHDDFTIMGLLMLKEMLSEDDKDEFILFIKNKFPQVSDSIDNRDLSILGIKSVNNYSYQQRLLLCFFLHLYGFAKGKDIVNDMIFVTVRNKLGIEDGFATYLTEVLPDSLYRWMNNENIIEKILSPDQSLRVFSVKVIKSFMRRKQLTNKKKLKGLDSSEYEHPEDIQTLNTLKSLSGFDTLVKKFFQFGIEKLYTVQYTGSYIKVNNKNFPYLYNALETVCEILDYQKIPDLYVKPGFIDAFTVGVEKPLIVITTAAASALTWDELLFILGHEVGHIKSQHNLYHTIAELFPYLGKIISAATLGLGNIFSQSLEFALLNWKRKSEFSADRAGLLACQNPDAAISAFMKLSGVPYKYYNSLRINDFIEQAKEFESLDEDGFSKTAKFLSIIWEDHPWTVVRADKLKKWIEDGSYKSIINDDNRNIITPEIKELPNIHQYEYCPNCGSPLSDSEQFCTNCGVKLDEV